jgi:hypothetical protein
MPSLGKPKINSSDIAEMPWIKIYKITAKMTATVINEIRVRKPKPMRWIIYRREELEIIIIGMLMLDNS